MTKKMTSEQAQQRVEALQKEAVRLAAHARVQLEDYARTLDRSKQAKFARAVVDDSRDQLQQSAAHASAQVVAAMASAFEEAAGQLRTHSGAGPVAQAAQHAAGMLEQSSEYIQPWGTRSMMRRVLRMVREHPVSATLVVLLSIGGAYLANRSKLATS